MMKVCKRGYPNLHQRPGEQQGCADSGRSQDHDRAAGIDPKRSYGDAMDKTGEPGDCAPNLCTVQPVHSDDAAIGGQVLVGLIVPGAQGRVPAPRSAEDG